MSKENSIVKIISGSIIGLAIVIAGFSSMTNVKVGCTGVSVKMGKVQEQTYTEGFHFKTPFIESVVDIDNKVQVKEVEAASISKAGGTGSCKERNGKIQCGRSGNESFSCIN